MTGRRSSRRRGSDRGVVATEAAVTVPAALLLILILVQAGVWWHATHIAHATADIALTAARGEGGTVEDSHAQATGMLNDLGGGGLLHDPQIHIERADTVLVRVSGEAATVIPGLSLPVRVELTGPVEQFTTPHTE